MDEPSLPLPPDSRTTPTGAGTGRAAEDLACRYLQDLGLHLLERNYSCKRGEIDLVMRDTSHIVFVEVRYRRNNRFGSGAESVNRYKQARLTATALHYLQSNKTAAKSPARFDVISITIKGMPGHRQTVLSEHTFEIQWIKNAFEASS